MATSQRLSHTSSTRGEGAWGPTRPETVTRLADPSTLRAVESGSRLCSQPACDRDGYAASLVCGYCTSASHRTQTDRHTHTHIHYTQDVQGGRRTGGQVLVEATRPEGLDAVRVRRDHCSRETAALGQGVTRDKVEETGFG